MPAGFDQIGSVDSILGEDGVVNIVCIKIYHCHHSRSLSKSLDLWYCVIGTKKGLAPCRQK